MKSYIKPQTVAIELISEHDDIFTLVKYSISEGTPVVVTMEEEEPISNPD